jgi:hypothetical protein
MRMRQILSIVGTSQNAKAVQLEPGCAGALLPQARSNSLQRSVTIAPAAQPGFKTIDRTGLLNG